MRRIIIATTLSSHAGLVPRATGLDFGDRLADAAGAGSRRPRRQRLGARVRQPDAGVDRVRPAARFAPACAPSKRAAKGAALSSGACPAASRIGSGRALVRAGGLLVANLPATIDVFLAERVEPSDLRASSSSSAGGGGRSTTAR